MKGKPKGPKIPYRLPELLEAPLDAWVLICAGEKDADTAAALGFVATTNSEGESPGKWTPDLNAWFVGRKRVAVMEDNDATGRAHALEVVGAMRSIGVPDVRVVTFRELPEHGDLTDWIEPGPRCKEDLQARIDAAQPAEPEISILPKAEFLRGFVPPDYLIDGILQRRFIYSLTGQTGHAKTAIALRLAQFVDCGGTLDGHEVARGRVAYLVGENPDDVRMRVIGDDAVLGNAGNGNIIFVPGVFDTDALLRKVESLGELDLVIIDTSAAYFLGDDENSNPQLGDHARKLRKADRTAWRALRLGAVSPDQARGRAGAIAAARRRRLPRRDGRQRHGMEGRPSDHAAPLRQVARPGLRADHLPSGPGLKSPSCKTARAA